MVLRSTAIVCLSVSEPDRLLSMSPILARRPPQPSLPAYLRPRYMPLKFRRSIRLVWGFGAQPASMSQRKVSISFCFLLTAFRRYQPMSRISKRRLSEELNVRAHLPIAIPLLVQSGLLWRKRPEHHHSLRALSAQSIQVGFWSCSLHCLSSRLSICFCEHFSAVMYMPAWKHRKQRQRLHRY